MDGEAGASVAGSAWCGLWLVEFVVRFFRRNKSSHAVSHTFHSRTVNFLKRTASRTATKQPHTRNAPTHLDVVSGVAQKNHGSAATSTASDGAGRAPHAGGLLHRKSHSVASSDGGRRQLGGHQGAGRECSNQTGSGVEPAVHAISFAVLGNGNVEIQVVLESEDDQKHSLFNDRLPIYCYVRNTTSPPVMSQERWYNL